MKKIAFIISFFFSLAAFGQISVNTNFKVNSNLPIDSRDTLTTLADTANVVWTVIGNPTYVADIDQHWYYTGSFWKQLETGAGDPAMGGDLSGTASNAQIASGAVGYSELSTAAKDSLRLLPFQKIITQSSHGFSVGQLLNIKSYGTGQLADADIDSLFAVGIVAKVIDVNNYVIQTGGIMTISGVVAGQQYYTSGTAGAVTTIAPTKVQVAYQGIATNTARLVFDRFSETDVVVDTTGIDSLENYTYARINELGKIRDTITYGYLDLDTGSATMTSSNLWFDNIPVQKTGRLEQLKVWSNGIGTARLKIARKKNTATGKNATIVIDILLTLTTGENTFTVGDGTIPSELIIQEGDYIGFWGNGVVRYGTGMGRRVLETFPTGNQSGDVIIKPQINLRKIMYSAKIVGYDLQESSLTQKYILSEGFDIDTIPSTFYDDNSWYFQGGYAVSTTTAKLQSNKYSRLNIATLRSKFKFGTSTSRAMFARQQIGFAGGTIVEVDAETSRMYYYNSWDGNSTLPAKYDSISLSFTIDTTREFTIELRKSDKTLTAILWDMVSGLSDTLTADDITGQPVGMMYGRPVFWAQEGVVMLNTAQYFVPQTEKKVKVLFCGDSITEGSGTTIPENFSSLSIAAIGGNGYKSTRAGDLSANIVRYAISDAENVNFPEYLVILAGTNDTDTTTWKTNMDNLSNFCEQFNINLIVCHVPPEDADTTPIVFNNYIQAQGWATVRFDLALTTGNDGVTRNASLYADSLHPNAAGHVIMYNRLRLDQPQIFD